MESKTSKWALDSRKNIRRLAYWTIGWALATAAARTGANFLWDHDPRISTAAIIISTVIGVGMILMNRKYINELDEMHRKITMDALALAFGVGVVGGASYSLLADTRILPFEAKISWLIALMAVTYAVTFIVGSIRYK